MDPFAHRLANALVGNSKHAATLEITLTGPTVSFEGSHHFAVTGADFELFLDEKSVPSHTLVAAPSGSVLRFGARLRGARAYLALAGGIDTPVVLGSRATHVSTRMGGLHGRAVTRGDRLPVGPCDRTVAATPDVGLAIPVGETPVVRVLAGPQTDRFVPDALEQLVSAPYRARPESNRMGFQLSGPPIQHRAGADVISDATPLGSLQVPANGQPVLLMADRQTTGGYAKLATVISADIGVAGQVAPGEYLQFRLCGRAEALAALAAREEWLQSLEARCL
jgi:antagonist of KipI